MEKAEKPRLGRRSDSPLPRYAWLRLSLLFIQISLPSYVQKLFLPDGFQGLSIQGPSSADPVMILSFKLELAGSKIGTHLLVVLPTVAP